jgi:hypothetical protein
MPPKPKKKSVKDLENDLLALQLEKHQSETTLLDTNRRLASELSSYKALLVSLQREKDITHDVKEKELKQELIELRSKVSRLELLSANAARDAAQVDSLTNERMILLKQQQDMIAERVEAGKIYAKDTADLKAQLSTLKYRLESTFADTLKTAVVEEKRRLHLALDAEAQSALADVGALRIQNATQARQIAQLVRVAEDRLHEADARAAEARAADERATHSELKLAQQAPHAQQSLRKINLEMEGLKVDKAELEIKLKAANEKINLLVAGTTSAHHLSSSRTNEPPQLVTRLLQSNLQHGRMRPNSASSFISNTISLSSPNVIEEDAESDLLNAMIGSGSSSSSSSLSPMLGQGQEKRGQGRLATRQRPQSAQVVKSSPLSQLPPIAEDWIGGNSNKIDEEKRRPISAASTIRPSSAVSSVSVGGGSSRPSSAKTFGYGIVVSPLR